ncbi:MAG: hypothetical protein RQ741_04995 [Wenzhouxiangellaceae bacterium]|nr:hypothetical protein [Wenzhouxiangellaceae bacterium]
MAKREHKFLLDDGIRKVEQGLLALDELRRLGALGAKAVLKHDTLMAG